MQRRLPTRKCGHPTISDSYRTLRERDAQLQDIGWRLQHANADFCNSARYGTGLQIDDAASYTDPEAMRDANGATGDFIVQSVAADSPADRAGLQPGMEIAAIDALMLATTAFDPGQPWQRAADIAALLAPARPGPLTIAFAGNTAAIRVKPVPICESRLELLTKSAIAVADGKRIVFGSEFAGFAYAPDELAAAVAHELAHNILQHRGWLDANGRKRSNIRQTEREADRLAPWLLANAGYDPQAALRFMQRWGPDNNGGLRLFAHHDGWADRAALMRAEIPHIIAAVAAYGRADWRKRFRSESASYLAPSPTLGSSSNPD